MICPNCGANNEATYQFCMKCGTSLSGVSPAVAVEELPNGHENTAAPPIGIQSPSRKKDLLKDKITPAEGEVSVRTYYCTYYLSRLLGLEAWGYLGVTNKRVIFQALGTSNAGSSVIQSELPIADVSGISSYKGTFFSFTHLLTAFFASLISSSMISLFMALLSGIVIALIVRYSENPELTSNSYLVPSILGWILGVGAFLVSFAFPRHVIWKSIAVAISGVGFVLAGGGGLAGRVVSFFFSNNETATILAGLSFFFGALAGIYGLFCMVWYSRRPTFSLAISSKGGSDTPISISGASGLGLFNVSAGKALTAEPAPDAEHMLEELGAVILDVQTLGDMGINKWKVF
jgi:hypothetical protein